MEAVPYERATTELAAHLAPVFESSPDGVYVWLDEEHWIGNECFASLFGYGSAEELNDTPHLLRRLVHDEDQELFSWNYWNRSSPSLSPQPSASEASGRTAPTAWSKPT